MPAVFEEVAIEKIQYEHGHVYTALRKLEMEGVTGAKGDGMEVGTTRIKDDEAWLSLADPGLVRSSICLIIKSHIPC